MNSAHHDPYRNLKDAFGRFATGVTIATCPHKDGGFSAITVNSFASVSLEPSLVLWCIEKRASSFSFFDQSDCYGISVLRGDQQDVSQRFARHDALPLAEDEYEIWETGAPILRDRLAGFDCRVIDRHPAGDHIILIAETVRYDAKPGKPLLYYGSRYGEGPMAE